MAARLVDDLRQLILGVAVSLDELAVGLGFLQRVEILALDILDQRDLGSRRIVDFADNRGDAVELSSLRRAPPPFAGDDLEAVAVGTEQDWLEHAALGDRLGQLGNCLLVELDARLVRIGADAPDLDLTDATGSAADLVRVKVTKLRSAA